MWPFTIYFESFFTSSFIQSRENAAKLLRFIICCCCNYYVTSAGFTMFGDKISNRLNSSTALDCSTCFSFKICSKFNLIKNLLFIFLEIGFKLQKISYIYDLNINKNNPYITSFQFKSKVVNCIVTSIAASVNRPIKVW